jgi:hypothetical protein
VLFSQPELATFLSESFECAWESVRPVPRVSIDFGNGHRLERTLRGNIATYLCTSAGETFDLLAGLVDAAEYRARLAQGLGLFAELREARAASGGAVLERVALWHRERALAPAGAPLAPDPSYAKFRVENPLEQQVAPGPVQLLGPAGAVLASPGAGGAAGESPFVSKRDVELPLESEWERTRAGVEALALDTLYQRRQGYGQAHLLLASRALEKPAALQHEVYGSLLHVDLDDPYLGLAPDVPGGEVGHH